MKRETLSMVYLFALIFTGTVAIISEVLALHGHIGWDVASGGLLSFTSVLASYACAKGVYL